MILDVKDISFAYKNGSPVFENISLHFESSDFLCFLGANGSGKSTLLKCIIGFLHPQSGNVCFNGKSIKEYSRRNIARMVAYVPQNLAPAVSFSVIDVVTMGRTSHIGLFSTPNKEDMEKAYECLEFLNISHLCNRPYTSLSGGERQLVVIASALAQEPLMMLLDEPTANLDFGNQYRFLDILRQLSEKGMGIIMTTHHPDHALLYADKVAVLNHGAIDLAGNPKDIITTEHMRNLYGIDVEIIDTDTCQGCIPKSRITNRRT